MPAKRIDSVVQELYGSCFQRHASRIESVAQEHMLQQYYKRHISFVCLQSSSLNEFKLIHGSIAIVHY